MVDSALVWISLATLTSGVAAVAFAVHYARTAEADYTAFAFAVVFGGLGLELGVANGYLPESGPFDAIVGVCVVIGVVAGAVGVRRRQRGFQVLRDDQR